ncbi:MAG TPA: tetratricopeptide repeat protein [Chthonomonadaceae bacterium]|nr:tetratricopeptide repeat protein [Chthonomonadaceae bacterium]
MKRKLLVKATPRAWFGAILLVLGALAAVLNLRYWQNKPVNDHLLQGSTWARAGKLADAEQEWRTALRLDPTRQEPYQLLSNLYLNTDHPDLAIPLLTHLRQIAPRSRHTLCNLTEAYIRIEDKQAALQTARQAVTLEPDCPRAHALLGILLGDQEDTRGAVAELTRATELAPADDKIALSLAQALLDGNDLVGAERIARQVIARNPSYPTAYYTLGRAYSRRTPTPENLREAIAAFQKATELRPTWGDAYSELGRLRLQAGDNAGAIAALEYLWKRGVRTEEAAYNLASAYRKVGNQARADQMNQEFKRISDYNRKYEVLRKHLSVEPNNAEVALQLAQLEIKGGSLVEARDLLEGVLKLRPRDPRALQAAIQLYDKGGDKKLASAYRERLANVERETKEAKR